MSGADRHHAFEIMYFVLEAVGAETPGANGLATRTKTGSTVNAASIRSDTGRCQL